jgi:hypothetical protein
MVLISCEKTITDYVDLASWTVDKRVQTNSQYILNSKIYENDLHFYASNIRGYLDTNSDDSELWIYNSTFHENTKNHMDNEFSIGTSEDEDGVIVYSKDVTNSHLIFDNNGTYRSELTPSILDSTFTNSAKILRGHNQLENITSNGNGQFLFFFNHWAGNNIEKKGTFACLVTISVHQIFGQIYDFAYTVDNFKITKLSDYSQSVSALYYYNQNYYCSLYENYIIDVEGNVSYSNIFYICTTFFEYNSKLWTLSDNHFWNTDDGINWIETPYTLSTYLCFFEFEGKLCGYRFSTLYEIDFENVEVYYLDVSGLDYHTITSINFCDSKVYLSTLGGMYYRNKSDFFKDKSTSVQRGNQIELKKK